MPAEGTLWEPNSLMNVSVISGWSMLTCRFLQTTGSPDEEGVGNARVTVAVGCGRAVVPAGVGESPPALEQAAKTNSPMNRMVIICFMGMTKNPSNFNTYELSFQFRSLIQWAKNRFVRNLVYSAALLFWTPFHVDVSLPGASKKFLYSPSI